VLVLLLLWFWAGLLHFNSSPSPRHRFCSRPLLFITLLLLPHLGLHHVEPLVPVIIILLLLLLLLLCTPLFILPFTSLKRIHQPHTKLPMQPTLTNRCWCGRCMIGA